MHDPQAYEYVVVRVWRSERPRGGPLEVRREHPGGAEGGREPVRPRAVAQMIRLGLRHGWAPEVRGAPYVLGSDALA